MASSCGELSDETELELDDVISARDQIFGLFSELAALELLIVRCPSDDLTQMGICVGERRTSEFCVGGGVTLLTGPRGDRAVSELWSELLPSL